MSKEKKTREDVAKAEIGHTDIQRPVAQFLVVMFLAVIFGVPTIQHVLGMRDIAGDESSHRIAFYKTFSGARTSVLEAWQEAPSPMARILAPNRELLRRMHDFEDQLDDTCFLTTLSRRPIQSLLLKVGVGNEKVVLGYNGWLFYEPGLSHVIGPPFFDEEQLLKRAMAGGEWNKAIESNPIEAITRFRDRLQDLRIELVVVPVPTKATIHAEQLSRRVKEGDGAYHSSSYWDLIERLHDAGVHYVDPTAILMKTRKKNGVAYLKTDTHWRPGAMRQVAREISELLLGEGLLFDPVPSRDYSRRERSITNRGDIVAMLDVPNAEDLYPQETVVIEQIVDDKEKLWEVSHDSQILVLGDSFANIYSQGDMKWGEGAGLAEQISCELQQPVDAIIQNDSGAFATRAKLAAELARGRNRLKGKSVIVWQFAARELSFGNWKVIDPVLNEAVALDPGRDHELRDITCRVRDVSNRPRKDVPYKNFIMKLLVSDMVDSAGRKVDEGDGVVLVLGMKDRKILPIAHVQKEAELSLKIGLWEDVETKYRRIKQGELSDEMLEHEKNLYFVEE